MAKKIKIEDLTAELTPIQEYELGLSYEDMADKLQIEEYRARYYTRARDIFKHLVAMVKEGEITFAEEMPEAEPAEADPQDAEPSEEEEAEEISAPESFTDDEDGADHKPAEPDRTDDPEYIRKCLSLKNLKKVRNRVREKAYASRAKTIIEAYQSASDLRDHAATAAELRYAADQYEGMAKLIKKNKLLEKHTEPGLYAQAMACNDYEEQAAKLKKRAMKMEQRIRLRLLMLGAAAILVLLIVFGFTKTSTYLKLKGDFEMMIGMEDKAWQAYGSALKDHGREDLRGTYDAARRAAGIKAYNEGSWDTARDTLREIAQSGDAEADAMYAGAEKKHIAAAHAGQTVHFAGTDWTVLENDGSEALLLRLENIPEVAFSADGKPCTWADSSLRAYLNDSYIAEKFTPEEAALLLESDLAEEPSQTGAAVNPATSDRVYIFSIGEFEQYKNLFPEWKKDTWLRTPGEHAGMEAFAGIENKVMPNGYDVGTDAIRVKPVIKVDLS